ncbi:MULTISPECIES: alginate lyase family protein [Luteimonas]|uniref:alginate lyase family protein n=1 Tax=Luteimonas TaxID=83614 RepID=UPI0013043F18|nr:MULTISPECIES: alginate lyase family protein [Luteimonas]
MFRMSWWLDRLSRRSGASAPASPVLEKSDFAIFHAGYEAQQASGFRPRNGMKAVRIALPLDWNADPLHDRNWRFQLHAWRMLGPVWEKFYDQDWGRLREEVLPWIEDWYRFHIVEDNASEFAWYDMAVGIRCQHLALILHLHDTRRMPLGHDHLKMVEHLCRLHHDKLRVAGFIARNNHGIFQVHGLRLLGVAWAHREGFAGEAAYSSKMMLALLRTQFDSHGIHVENSPDYHGLILKQFARIRPALFPAIASHITRTVRLAREALPWFTLPDGRMVPLGDSEGLGTALGAAAKADLVIGEVGAGATLVRDMSASGYVVVRSEPGTADETASMLVAKGVGRSRTHAHADDLSFFLYEGGKPLLVDPGKYSYGQDKWRHYFTSDRAHNVVGLKGVAMGPQHLQEARGDFSVAQEPDGVLRIEGEVGRRDFFVHARSIRYAPGRFVEVDDRIQAREDDAPIVYWHLSPHLDAERFNGGVAVYDNGRIVARLRVDDPRVKARLVHGQEKPVIQGWVSPRYNERVAATVIQFQGSSDVRHVRTMIELTNRSRLPAHRLPRRLTHDVRFRFPFEFRRDRVFLLPSGATQRRVVVGVQGVEPGTVAKRLAKELDGAGFVPQGRGRIGFGDVGTYAHPDGTRVTVKLKEGVCTEGRDATPPTLYFAWSRSGAATKID